RRLAEPEILEERQERRGGRGDGHDPVVGGREQAGEHQRGADAQQEAARLSHDRGGTAGPGRGPQILGPDWGRRLKVFDPTCWRLQYGTSHCPTSRDASEGAGVVGPGPWTLPSVSVCVAARSEMGLSRRVNDACAADRATRMSG